jgi:hypothetical protein
VSEHGRHRGGGREEGCIQCDRAEIERLSAQLLSAREANAGFRTNEIALEAKLSAAVADRDKAEAQLATAIADKEEAQKQTAAWQNRAKSIEDGAFCFACDVPALCDEDGCCQGCGSDIPAAQGYVHGAALSTERTAREKAETSYAREREAFAQERDARHALESALSTERTAREKAEAALAAVDEECARQLEVDKYKARLDAQTVSLERMRGALEAADKRARKPYWLVERIEQGSMVGWAKWRGLDKLEWTRNAHEADRFDWVVAAQREARLLEQNWNYWDRGNTDAKYRPTFVATEHMDCDPAATDALSAPVSAGEALLRAALEFAAFWEDGPVFDDGKEMDRAADALKFKLLDAYRAELAERGGR